MLRTFWHRLVINKAWEMHWGLFEICFVRTIGAKNDKAASAAKATSWAHINANPIKPLKTKRSHASKVVTKYASTSLMR